MCEQVGIKIAQQQLQQQPVKQIFSTPLGQISSCIVHAQQQHQQAAKVGW
jgi:hypothetical protein